MNPWTDLHKILIWNLGNHGNVLGWFYNCKVRGLTFKNLGSRPPSKIDNVWVNGWSNYEQLGSTGFPRYSALLKGTIANWALLALHGG